MANMSERPALLPADAAAELLGLPQAPPLGGTLAQTLMTAIVRREEGRPPAEPRAPKLGPSNPDPWPIASQVRL